MTITIKDICNTFKVSSDKVRQVNSMQLFIVDTCHGRKLVSYKTIVGRFVNNTWEFTNKKYDQTTSRQLSIFKRKTVFPITHVEDI